MVGVSDGYKGYTTMKRIPSSAWVLLIGVLIGIGQIVFLGPLLPERVASHFGPSGAADGWMTRSEFLRSEMIMLVFVVGIFTINPILIAHTPVEMVNLPNKAYWLAPERRAKTFAILTNQMLSFGAATLALMVSIMQTVYEVNIKGGTHLSDGIWLTLGAYVIYTVIWSVGLVRRFSLPSS